MKTEFDKDNDELTVSLAVEERKILRRARSLTREIGRYLPHAVATAEGLGKIIDAVNGDGVLAHKPVEQTHPTLTTGGTVPADHPEKGKK